MKIITVLYFRLIMATSGLSDVAIISGETVQGLPHTSQYISTSKTSVWLMNFSTRLPGESTKKEYYKL